MRTAIAFLVALAATGCDRATAPTGCAWVEHANNPLIRSDAAPDGLMGDPFVVRTGLSYAMYYGAVPGDFSNPELVRIFRATSPDGLVWTRNGVPVLEAGASGSWDSVKVETPTVLRLPDGTYRMYYAGNDVPGSEFGYRIGLTESADGVNWTRHPANPVLSFGGTGEFDEMSLLDPEVLYDPANARYLLWYAGISKTSTLAIGLATSTDGISWQKQGVVLKLDVERRSAADFGVLEPAAVWNRGEIEMAYAVIGGDPAIVGPIWLATSPDGRTWRNGYAPAISLGANPSSWKAQGASSPTLLFEGGQLRLWFVGTRTDFSTYLETGIGLATRTCP